MICRTCMWWKRKMATVGRCRRRAPTMRGWPVLFATDYCGEHKLDEAEYIAWQHEQSQREQRGRDVCDKAGCTFPNEAAGPVRDARFGRDELCR